MFLGEYLEWWNKASFIMQKYPIEQSDKSSFIAFHRYALSNRCYADVSNEINRILIEEYMLSDKDKKELGENRK